MNTLIETNSLCKSFRVGGENVQVLKDISFTIEQNEFVSIMGPSGCGKSTLLYLLGALDNPSSGTIKVNNKDINKLNDNEKSFVRRRDLGFVFQFYNLVQNLTVEENILLPILMDGKKAKDYKSGLEELLDVIELTNRRKYTPRELSGGQQQRVAIARSLINNPNIILADEPTGNLDSKTGKEVMELFRRINKEKGKTIVQVTHSPELAEYGNRIIFLKDGIIEKSFKRG